VSGARVPAPRAPAVRRPVVLAVLAPAVRRALVLAVLALAAARASAIVPPAAGPAALAPLPASAPAALAPPPDAALPMAASFVDAAGRARTLGEMVAGRSPVLLVLGYDRCPQLCGLVLQGALEAAHAAGLPADAYRLVFVSIDPADTPADAAARERVERDYARFLAGGTAAPAIAMLVGRPPAIAALAGRVGVRYATTPGAGDARFAHPAALFVVAPDGRVARTFGGIRYDAAALRSAVADAARGRVDARLGERIALLCAHLDPRGGRWSADVLALARVVGLATLAALTALAWRSRRGRRR
jgi:protein SCO1/2